MKQSHSTSRRILALALIPLSLGSCKPNDGGLIPYNKEKASRHLIPLAQGIRLQDQFLERRKELSGLLTDSSFLTNRFSLPNAETFNRDAIALLLNQPGADGIRIYLGTDKNGKLRLVLVPVDSSGKEILRQLIGSPAAPSAPPAPAAPESAAPPGEEGETRKAEVMEMGQICPPCKLGATADVQ